MYQRLAFTFATAVSLMGLYGLYSVAMRPIVVVPVPPKQTIEDSIDDEPVLPAENVRIAEAHVPLAKWAAKSQHTLRVEQAFIYTDEWWIDEENKKLVHFKPFAMVWITPDKENAKEEAFSVICEEAQLEFASAFDERNRNLGRVVRGILDGNVKIAGPQNFEVRGQSFVFEEDSLRFYTYQPVWFQFQSHVGEANRMEMKLIPAEGVPGVDRPHVRGIESVRLIAGSNARDVKHQLVNLIVQMPQGKELIPINVRCAGDLEYTFANNTAVLTTDVRAVTGRDEKSKQWLECDTLTMKFKPKKNLIVEKTTESEVDPVSGTPADPEFDMIESNLEFSSFEAKSAESNGLPVKIVSPSRQIRATMNCLHYDAQTQMLTMTSESSKKIVDVRLKQAQLLVPELKRNSVRTH